jgi:hypothetical protein
MLEACKSLPNQLILKIVSAKRKFVSKEEIVWKAYA